MIRRVLRALGATLAVLFVVAALSVAALLLVPERILTTRSVGWAVQKLGRSYRPAWESFDFEIRSRDLLEKEIFISAGDVRFAEPDGSLSARVASLAARFTFEVAPTGVRLTRLDRLELEGGKVRMKEAASAAKPAGSKGGVNPYQLTRLLPAALSGLKLGRLRIDLPSVELASPRGTTRASLRADFDPARSDRLSLAARWATVADGAVDRGRLDASVDSDFFRTGRLSSIDAKGTASAAGARAEFAATARQAGAEAVSLDVSASGRREDLSFRFRGRGVETPSRFSLGGGLRVEASTGPLRSARLEPFELSAELKKNASYPASVRLQAGLEVEPSSFVSAGAPASPQRVAGRLVVNVRFTPRLLEKDRFDADASLVLNPYMSWYEAHADVFARASGRLSALARMKIEQKVDASLSIARFQDLVAFLAGGPFAVPAPLDALKGGLRATFSGGGDPRSDRAEFELRARADLAGERQKLKLSVAGSGAATRLLDPQRRLEARVKATLDDVAVQLPHLDALKIPKVTLDPRIRTSVPIEDPPEKAAVAEPALSTSSVALDVSVATARPILLYSDLAKTPVPIALDLKTDVLSGQVGGTVSVQSFDVEFFRRRATVDHLTLMLRAGSKLVGLDGLVKYKAAEAAISIRLLGTTDKPRVVFESDPPMSQSDIIAMLVFGKSPDDLDVDQAASVANAQTAISDEAFGLASLYLFASTPIQFVGYDPASKSYTMKFSIPGGETLSLNSDFDATKSVQLRKRLSRHFAVVEEAVNSTTEGNGFVTFLEWFTRY